jgi:hypothetical protein
MRRRSKNRGCRFDTKTSRRLSFVARLCGTDAFTINAAQFHRIAGVVEFYPGGCEGRHNLGDGFGR